MHMISTRAALGGAIKGFIIRSFCQRTFAGEVSERGQYDRIPHTKYTGNYTLDL